MLKDITSRFLLVFLSIEMILQEATIYRRRQKLRAVKKGVDLGGAYEATLGRIQAQGGQRAKLGMAVLMWISHSGRPLQVEAIRHAIAIQTGSDCLNNDDIPSISTLLGCCQGLAIIEKGTSTVRLIHFTIQEYLCTHPGLFDKANATMAETCLAYLNFQHIKCLSADPSPDSRCTPFLEYSSLYWGAHMKIELSDRAKSFALQLLDQFDSHISAKSLWKSLIKGLPFYYYPGDKPFSALHCISYFGIAEIANILIKRNWWGVNKRDSAGMTPLIWAARYGHEEVVRLLLRKKHILPDRKDIGGSRTALSWAAGNGHEGVVRLFLGRRFVNPRSVDRRWGKALRVAGLLFSWRYVNPESSSRYGRKPLSWAAGNGHEGVMKLLLARNDVSPDTPDTVYGRTPLSWAAENGHEGAVKLLLEWKDVNPDSSSKSGRTPLSWAAGNGHERVVNALLEREDVNPNRSSNSGQTPLLWAARNSHGGIVKLLLQRADIYPDIPDAVYGRTPLSWAAGNGHAGIVKLLLGRSDVNPDPPDTEYRRTPLSWAAENGHEEIVRLLLKRRDVNPNCSSKSGLTPLALATVNRHDRIVRLLLPLHPRRSP